MKLFLARHGNTFDPGDKVVWAGYNDLPLVQRGREQAKEVAEKLRNEELTTVFVGPLKRTLEFGEIIRDSLNFEGRFEIDQRLKEIDYGPWTGLSNQEVEEQFGGDAQERWNKFSEWPQDSGWGGTEAEMIDNCFKVVNQLQDEYPDNSSHLLVSSNGTLRYFLKLIDGEFEGRVNSSQFKMKTGALSLLEFSKDSGWSVAFWNNSFPN